MEALTPRLIIYFGCALAFGAAFINAGFLIIAGVSVSHLTGDVSRIANDLVVLDASHVVNLIKVSLALIGFVLGAFFSGYFIHHPEVETRLPYGRVLVLLGSLLIVSWFSIPQFYLISIVICSFVCGAQNAMASRFKGTVLRTTHLTGLLTELGIYLGMKLKGHKIENWKLYIPVYLSISFLAGAILSSYIVLNYNHVWLLLAGTFYIVGGFSWLTYKYFNMNDSTSSK